MSRKRLYTVNNPEDKSCFTCDLAGLCVIHKAFCKAFDAAECAGAYTTEQIYKELWPVVGAKCAQRTV